MCFCDRLFYCTQGCDVWAYISGVIANIEHVFSFRGHSFERVCMCKCKRVCVCERARCNKMLSQWHYVLLGSHPRIWYAAEQNIAVSSYHVHAVHVSQAKGNVSTWLHIYMYMYQSQWECRLMTIRRLNVREWAFICITDLKLYIFQQLPREKVRHSYFLMKKRTTKQQPETNKILIRAEL